MSNPFKLKLVPLYSAVVAITHDRYFLDNVAGRGGHPLHPTPLTHSLFYTTQRMTVCS